MLAGLYVHVERVDVGAVHVIPQAHAFARQAGRRRNRGADQSGRVVIFPGRRRLDEDVVSASCDGE